VLQYLRVYSATLGEDVLTLKNTGNVGIGINEPQYKLDVKGQMRADNVTVKSDQRHKQNIHSLKNALTKLQGLRGVSFKWKDNTQNADTQIGLIAQEVEKVLPELVSTDSDGYKSIAYGKLTAVLVEAIKEQQLQIERLENLIPDNNQKWTLSESELSELKNFHLMFKFFFKPFITTRIIYNKGLDCAKFLYSWFC